MNASKIVRRLPETGHNWFSQILVFTFGLRALRAEIGTLRKSFLFCKCYTFTHASQENQSEKDDCDPGQKIYVVEVEWYQCISSKECICKEVVIAA